MKFADKYEILEMVTSGRVSTLLARERTTQEPVVVYTFECEATGASELSTASIIARFCALAPNPPGIIVKAGFDEPSSSAFITTKMPDPVALQEWVRAYQSFAKPGQPASSPVPKVSSPASDATAELSAAEVRAVLARSGSPRNQPPKDPPPIEEIGERTAAFSIGDLAPGESQSGSSQSGSPEPAGDFTRLFREVNAFQPLQSPAAAKSTGTPTPAKPSDATNALFGEPSGTAFPSRETFAPPPSTPPASSPGSFTREFMALSSDKGELEKSKTPVAPPAAPKTPGSFTQEFMAVSPQQIESSDGPVEKPGQFPPPAQNSVLSSTMFGSIFGPPSKSESPSASSEPSSTASSSNVFAEADSQKGGEGEFTNFFGGSPFAQPGPPPEKPFQVPDLASSTPPRQQAGDFTRMFGRDDIEPKDSTPLPSIEEASTPGSFTQIFSEPAPGRAQLGSSTLETNPGFRPSSSEPAPVPPSPPFQAHGGTASPAPPAQDFFAPRTPPPAPAVPDPLFTNRSGAREATEVFRAPGSQAPPFEEVASGPSEFTRIISGRQLQDMLSGAPPVPGASGGAAGPPPAFAPPPIPQPGPFSYAPPPPPPPPAMKYPPLAAPPAPALPAVPRPAFPPAAAKPASFWPLIAVLTILIAIGAMLVMYFALKH